MISAIAATAALVERRLSRRELLVILVGERGSGRSTFLDAIVGDRELGAVLSQDRAVTQLQKRPLPSYRAKFASGAVEDFSRRAPDRTLEIAEQLKDIDLALSDAESALGRLSALEPEEAEAVREHQAQAAEARSAVERATNAHQQLSAELAGVSDEAEQAGTALAEVERTVPPSIRNRPPWWAVWLWFFYIVFAWLRREVWLTYSARKRRVDRAQERLLAARSQAQSAEEERARAESRLSELVPVLTKLQAAHAQITSDLGAARETVERLRADAQEQRAELAKHDESRLRRFFIDLKAVFDPRGRGHDLVEIAVDYPAKLLPEDVAILDVPGVTSESSEEQERAWNLIREEADGCILLSELDRAVSASTQRFVQRLRELVPHVLLVLTKMDQAFAEAVARGAENAWEQVETARRIGTRRFAREIGRDPDSVLSIAVSAEAALQGGGTLARRFETEVSKLFQLLAQERALILGARCAGAVRSCIASIAEAEARGAQAYQDRIVQLESQRSPEPDAFRTEELQAAAGAIDEAAREAVDQASTAARDGFNLLRSSSAQKILDIARAQELLDAAPRLESELAEAAAKVQANAFEQLEANVNGAVQRIEKGMLEALEQRYQILHRIPAETPTAAHFVPANHLPAPEMPLEQRVRDAWSSHNRLRAALGVGGVAVGAAVGTAVVPIFGTAVGAALGVLLNFSRTQTALKRKVVAETHEPLNAQEHYLVEALEAARSSAATVIRNALDASLQRAMTRFARWIAEPIQAEREAIAHEQANLADLSRLARELQQHDRRVAELMRAAVEESAGLCR
ncbi:MAG TPA: hypothetical protein VGJ84_17160 [Polyangiaceae bacterium]